MRLLKLLGYCAFGYLVYEFFHGLLYGPAGKSASGNGKSGDLERALNEDAGRMNMTGPALGKTIETDDSQGAHARHTVGRGVVHW